MQRERKNNLLTVRLTREETDALEYLSDCLGKNKSDVMSRACKYFVSTNTNGSLSKYVDECRGQEKESKSTRVHVRMTDSDVDQLKKMSLETGNTVSQLVRGSIRSLADATNGFY